MVLQNSGRYRPEKTSYSNNGGEDGGADGDGSDSKTELRLVASRTNDTIDKKYGFMRINAEFGRDEVGYLVRKIEEWKTKVYIDSISCQIILKSNISG